MYVIFSTCVYLINYISSFSVTVINHKRGHEHATQARHSWPQSFPNGRNLQRNVWVLKNELHVHFETPKERRGDAHSIIGDAQQVSFAFEVKMVVVLLKLGSQFLSNALNFNYSFSFIVKGDECLDC